MCATRFIVRLSGLVSCLKSCAERFDTDTHRDALNVYCGMWSPEMRREYLCACVFFRIRRLSPEHHPVAVRLKMWQDARGVDIRSFFQYADTVIRRQRRFQRISDGGTSFAEKETAYTPAPWIGRPKLTALPARDDAVRQHRALFESRSSSDIFVYTDGSCVENPGRAGLGILICTPSCSFVASEKVGIASILTAGLCANHRALQLLLSSCVKLLS